jgi:PAS domain S-box-containing protein
MSDAIDASAATMRTLSVGVAVVGTAAAMVAWVVGVETVLAVTLAIGLALVVAVTVAWFIVRRHPSPALPWALLLVSMVVVGAASTLWIEAGASDSVAEPSLRDALYLVGYLMSATAFVLIARSLGAGRDRGDIVDGLILAAGTAVVVWSLPANVAPAAGVSASPAAWAAVLSLPVIDLIIVAVLAILFMRIGRAVAVVAFLAGAVIAQFAGDSLFAFGQMGGDAELAGLVLPFSILSSAFLTAALLHPSSSVLVHDPGRAVPVAPRTRLALISSAAVVAAVVVLVQNLRTADPLGDVLLDVLAGIIVVLFAARAWMLTGSLTRAQAALDENAAMLAGIAEAMPGAILAGDLATKTVDYASPGVAGVHGYPVAEIVGRPGWLVEHLHPDDVEGFLVPDAAAEEAGRTGGTFQVRVRRPDGSYRTIAGNVRHVGEDGAPPTRFIAVVVDVTEAAETAARLAQREAFIAGITRAVRAMVVAGHARPGEPSVLDFVGPSIQEALGYTPEEVMATTGFIAERLHPDDEPFVTTIADALRRGEPIPDVIRRYRAKDGTYRSLLISSSATPEPDGSVRFVAAGIDVTDRIRLEDELRQARAFSDELVATSPGIIFAGRLHVPVIDFASRGVEEVLGYAPDEIVGVDRWFTDHIHPDDVSAHLAAVEAVVARGGGELTRETRIAAHDGSYRTLLYTARIACDGPAHAAYVASAIDITDRMDAQAELERQRDFIESLLSTTPGMIIRGPLLGDRIDYVSPGIREMLGYPPGDVIGAVGWPSAHRHPDDASTTAAAIRAATEEGRGRFTLVERYLAASGEWRWLLEIVNIEEPGDPSATYVATAIDVTDRVRMEEELRAARDAAQAADLAKSEFLSVVSHELRTPLNVILGFGDLLERADLAPDDRESAEYIVAAGRRLLGLIDRMLDYARLETGRLHVAAQPVLLDEVARLAIERVRGLAEERRALVVRAVGSEGGLVAVGDVVRLTSVVEDLIDNAIRHGGAGVHVSVATRCAAAGRVAISVTDDGVGMTEDQVARAFDPLRRDAAGTGATLGLALARRLVEAMGGTIGVRSLPGAGTVATVEVPAFAETLEGVGAAEDAGPARGAVGAPAGAEAAAHAGESMGR